MSLSLQNPITALPHIGSRTALLLSKLGIKTLSDLLFYFPFRYEDLSNVRKISDLQAGEVASVSASIWQLKTIRTRYGKFLTSALLNDGTGSVEAIWFNQYYLEKTLRSHENILIAGKVSVYHGKISFVSPRWEAVAQQESLHTARLVPVYPQTAGLNSRTLRERIKFALDQLASKVAETLPVEILTRENLPQISTALEQIHFPSSLELARCARDRFAFEELFFLQLASLERKKQNLSLQSRIAFEIPKVKIKELIGKLPFELTGAQHKAIAEILADYSSTKPMNRLLQGDVGSGKTLVAAVAAFVASYNGFRSLFMAPTEILAKQHYETLKQVFADCAVSVGLASGSEKIDTTASILVGTHALLNLEFEKEKVGLVVIDEQHRFGVEQRNVLRAKGNFPHVLTLSATPIPRTLALIFFGELDVSILDQMPRERKTPKTYLVGAEKRAGAYDFIRKHILSGEQAFIVCPLIEESETLRTVRSVKLEYERLTKEIFPDLKLGLLHGKLSSKAKNKVLDEFRNNDFSILVATPVVEVGLDIPNATTILIEAADRFGLASLHQLRGRVGRSDKQAFCLLFSDSQQTQRLKKMEKLTSGFDLAQADLEFRGPGEVFGTLQHGLPDLKIATLTDTQLIKKTRDWAQQISARKPNAGKKNLETTLSKKIKDLGID